MNLEDDDPEVFGLFNHWTFYENMNPNGQFPPFRMLIRLWVLADKFLCPNLKDRIMIRLKMVRHGRTSFLQDLSFIDKNTSRTSELRQYFIDYFAKNWRVQSNIQGLGDALEDVSKEFLFDIIARISHFESADNDEKS